MQRFLLLCALLLVIGCGGAARTPVSAVRFYNREPVAKVDDRENVPQQPENRPDYRLLDNFDSTLYRRLTYPMEVHRPIRAIGTNSLDEVPDSTWFTNRIGKHEVTPADVAAGPDPGGGPDLSQPITIVSGKVGGAAAGFIVKDAKGDRYILKFDEPRAPTMETATDVVVQRILWTAGWQVPNNTIGYFRREQLELADDAEVKSTVGRKRPMNQNDVESTLARVHLGDDGRYRGLFSEFLPGIPIGGIPLEGVREDDPNDTIPHQHRRELRGLALFASWLQHTDMKAANSLDIYAEDPRDKNRHFVVHYLVDFGKSLGTFVFLGKRPADGHTESFDKYYFQSALAFGLWKRPWEGLERPDIEGVGHYDVEHYRPDDYSPQAPYLPFLLADRHDMLWAANLMLRLTPAHLRAALEQGQYEDPRAVDYLLEMLIGRQRKAARYWLRKTNPLVDLVLEQSPAGPRVCFTDLLVAHELTPTAASSTYRARTFDRNGQPLGLDLRLTAETGAPTTCVSGLALSDTDDGYTILRLDTLRDQRALPAVEVHLARRPSDGQARIIGIERR